MGLCRMRNFNFYKTSFLLLQFGFEELRGWDPCELELVSYGTE